MKKLILASSSNSRIQLLKQLKIPFEFFSPNVDETPFPKESAKKLVIRLAELKTKTVAKNYKNSIIIGADQIGEYRKKLFGKPLTLKNAKKHLEELSGRTLKFYIGLCVLDTQTNLLQSDIEIFKVKYRKLNSKMIKDYLSKEKPLQCAGSCAADGFGITLIDSLEGKDFSALIGLPLIRLTRMLEKVGLNPLSK